ncbi:MAG: DNA polymerase III subunit chi [Paracoccaceae bacterium]
MTAGGAEGGAGEVGFYHLSETALDAALGAMLERALARSWRAEVRVGDGARLDALDRGLWCWRAESFVPHARAGGPLDARQPVLLADRPVGDGREALFLVHRARFDPTEAPGRRRVALVFDGADPEAVEHARSAWRLAVGAGLVATYWAQQGGGWSRRARSGE